METIEQQLTQLRDQAWTIARESIDRGETSIYRSLVEIVERLTILTSRQQQLKSDCTNDDDIIPIFKVCEGKRYEAQLDIKRLRTGDNKFIKFNGQWKAPSTAAIEIKKSLKNPPSKPETNGWNFWKYKDEQHRERSIDSLRHL